MSDRLFVTLKAIFLEIHIYKNGNIVNQEKWLCLCLVLKMTLSLKLVHFVDTVLQELLCVRDTLVVKRKWGKGDNKVLIRVTLLKGNAVGCILILS